jgi:hypothetical protein
MVDLVPDLQHRLRSICIQEKLLTYTIWESHIGEAYLDIQGGNRIHATRVARIKATAYGSHHPINGIIPEKLRRSLSRVIVTRFFSIWNLKAGFKTES